MPSSTLVDVIIPTFNRQSLTREAIQSVENQTTFSLLQLVIVEDGSDIFNRDNLPPYVKYIRQKDTRGPSSARNTGVRESNSPYIAFLDSDDLWAPTKIAKQLKLLEDNPSIQWAHTNEIWFRNGLEIRQRKEHKKQGGFLIERMFHRCLVSPSAVIFRRSFFEAYGYFLENFMVAEDFELWLRLNVHSALGFIEEPLTIKRAGDWPQLSSSYMLDHYRVLALHRFYRMFRNHELFDNWYPEWQKAVDKKLHILLKGSEKYQKYGENKRYQAWRRALAAARKS